MKDARPIHQALLDPNVKAFCHVVWKGETGDNGDEDYTRLNVPINGDYHFHPPPWVHPWHGQTTTSVGHSTAAGRPQYLGTTWAGLARDYPVECGQFTPQAQDFGMVALMAEVGALPHIIAGEFDRAVVLCRGQWSSLPGASENNPKWTLAKAAAHYASFGGKFDTQPAAPIEEASQPAQPAPVPQGVSMDPLSIINIVGAALSVLIPQVGKVFGGSKDAQNVQLAGTVLNAISTAAGTIKPGETASLGSTATAIEAMQKDPALKAAVTQAVITHPDVIGLVEVGGGIKAAREEAQKAVDSVVWWRPLVTPAFIVSFALMDIALSVLVDILYVHPASWTGSDRSQVLILCVSIISAVMGFYIGSSVSSQKKDETIAAVATGP